MKALIAAGLSFILVGGVLQIGDPAVPPTDAEKLAIVWADFCERKPEHIKCIPTPTPSPTPSPSPSSTPSPTPTMSPSPTATPTQTPVPSAPTASPSPTAVGTIPAWAHTQTYPCSAGYVQVEDQSWWLDAEGEEWPGRHIHQQMCWPTGVVTGTLTIPVRVLLHEQPPGARVVRVRIDDSSNRIWEQTTGFPDISGGGDISFTVNVTINTSTLSAGLHEMRLAVVVRQPTGVDQFVSSGKTLFVRQLNGGLTDRNYNEARAWYEQFDYVNARTRTPLAEFREMRAGDIFQSQCASPSGHDATACSVWANPDAHNGFPGYALAPEHPGEIARTVQLPAMEPGLHKLVVARSESTADLGEFSDGTNSALLVVTVLVPEG